MSSSAAAVDAVERPPDALDGIPVALRWLPLAGVVVWLGAAVFAVAYIVGR